MVKKVVVQLTPIIFLMFKGSLGSSKGYAPTNITYKATPEDQTSAIYNFYKIR